MDITDIGSMRLGNAKFYISATETNDATPLPEHLMVGVTPFHTIDAAAKIIHSNMTDDDESGGSLCIDIDCKAYFYSGVWELMTPSNPNQVKLRANDVIGDGILVIYHSGPAYPAPFGFDFTPHTIKSPKQCFNISRAEAKRLAMFILERL